MSTSGRGRCAGIRQLERFGISESLLTLLRMSWVSKRCFASGRIVEVDAGVDEMRFGWDGACRNTSPWRRAFRRPEAMPCARVFEKGAVARQRVEKQQHDGKRLLADERRLCIP